MRQHPSAFWASLKSKGFSWNGTIIWSGMMNGADTWAYSWGPLGTDKVFAESWEMNSTQSWLGFIDGDRFR